MKIIVTGAAGFIGFHLSKRLLEMGIEVVGIDNFNEYYDPSLKRARKDRLDAKSRSLNLSKENYLFEKLDLKTNWCKVETKYWNIFEC